MNQLQVINVKRGVIETNFNEFHEELKLQIQGYKNLVVTEENLADMKKSRLELTKGIKIIEDERKKQKKDFLAPLDEFEDICKQAVSTIKEAETELKEKIDYFDEIVRQEKLDYADLCKSNIKDKGSLNEKYFNRIDTRKSEFTNVTTSKKAIARDIEEQEFFLIRAQETEENNISFVSNQLEAATKLANLSTPLIYDDIRHLIASYEDMDTAKVGQGITEIALRRKEAEELAVKREAERLRAEAERLALEEVKRQQREEEAKRLEAERIEAEKLEAERKQAEQEEMLTVAAAEEPIETIDFNLVSDDLIDFSETSDDYIEEISSVTITGNKALIEEVKKYALSLGLSIL